MATTRLFRRLQDYTNKDVYVQYVPHALFPAITSGTTHPDLTVVSEAAHRSWPASPLRSVAIGAGRRRTAGPRSRSRARR